MKFSNSKLPSLAVALCMFLLVSPKTASCQALLDEDDEMMSPSITVSRTHEAPTRPYMASTTTTRRTPPTPTESTTTKRTTPTPTKSTTNESTSTEPSSTAETVKSTSSSMPPPTSHSHLSVPEGSYDSACNTTMDCQPDKNLRCLSGACLCHEPEVFDIREQRCIVPLGQPCLEAALEDDEDGSCPEFAECFMDRCVCKTGYSMYTMTRCKSDMLEVGAPAEETKLKTVLWPKQSLAQELDDKMGCGPNSCDESKGLTCQAGGACKCKDPKEVYIDEFGRCLGSQMQKSLKDALSLVSSSEDDIKSFVTLLERFEDGDHEASASENYEKPIHHILELLGDHHHSEGEGEGVTPSSTHSQLAPPGYYGDLHTAAQEPATESTVASHTDSDGEGSGDPATEGGQPHPSERSRPPRQDPIPTRDELGEPLTYGMESRESDDHNNHHYLPLDNYQPQGQEPAIVQRQAPPYGGGGGHHHQHGEGIPLHGYGVIPEETNHFRVPFGHHNRGYGGNHGGYGGYGGHGGHHGGYGGHGVGGYGGHGAGGYGGHGAGGYGGHGGGYGGHGGHGGIGHHHPPPRPPHRSSLMIEMAELLGRSFKLVDKFLPLVYVINDALKKEGIVGLDGHRGHRDVGKGKKEALIKEGVLLAGFTKFMGLLLRLKKRLDLLGGTEGLKKILT